MLQKKNVEAREASHRNDTRVLHKIIKQLTKSKSNKSIPTKDKNGDTLLTEKKAKRTMFRTFQRNSQQANVHIQFYTKVAYSKLHFQVD